MSEQEQSAGLSAQQRSAIVGQLARDWELVHGNDPGCLTGFMGMTDRQLIGEAQSYRSRAADAAGDNR